MNSILPALVTAVVLPAVLFWLFVLGDYTIRYALYVVGIVLVIFVVFEVFTGVNNASILDLCK